jgi:hypothetical protein
VLSLEVASFQKLAAGLKIAFVCVPGKKKEKD